ncbi:MAG: hypothetical protein ACFHHU_00230 [Porticoccaceae bacterium]
MTNVTRIYELVDQLQSAEHRVTAAQRAVEADKVARSGSFIARAVDALSTTAAEAALREAATGLERTRKQTRMDARTWIRETARASLISNLVDKDKHEALCFQIERSEVRVARVWAWQRLARDADEKLSRAASMCSNASSMEVLDLVTSSTAISLISSGSTVDAGRSIQSARAAMKRLAKALPNHTEQLDVDVPDDMLDLVIDLTISPLLDVLSWFNIGKLNDARKQCLRAQQAIRPLVRQLNKLERELCTQRDAGRRELRYLEAPYLEAAAEKVPAVLQVPTPKAFA